MIPIVDGNTQVCAVIGDPVEHSLSPRMHNAAFYELELPFVYVPFRVTDVRKAIDGIIGLGLRGVSVTIPHKTAVMPFLDEIDDLARAIGAVNTITNDNGVLKGTNTDCYGALTAIELNTQTSDKYVMILGVGGAARAIAFYLACKRKPAALIFAVRNPEKAKPLLEDLRPHTSAMLLSISFDDESFLHRFQTCDIIINCTPVGMYPRVDECLIPEDHFRTSQVVFDTIYNPNKTLLLQRAERQGATIINGGPMLVHQGGMQFELWTGKKPPLKVMKAVVTNALERQ